MSRLIALLVGSVVAVGVGQSACSPQLPIPRLPSGEGAIAGDYAPPDSALQASGSATVVQLRPSGGTLGAAPPSTCGHFRRDQILVRLS
jgi:hypothetical protein